MGSVRWFHESVMRLQRPWIHSRVCAPACVSICYQMNVDDFLHSLWQAESRHAAASHGVVQLFKGNYDAFVWRGSWSHEHEWSVQSCWHLFTVLKWLQILAPPLPCCSACLLSVLTGRGLCVVRDAAQEHDVETAHGVLHVTMRGAAKGNRPTILTYHDIGLNRE